MIGPTGAVRVMVATKPVDFRKGAEGLAALVRETMASDPFSGAVYVFRAKRADRIKLVFHDNREGRQGGNGEKALGQKGLEHVLILESAFGPSGRIGIPPALRSKVPVGLTKGILKPTLASTGVAALYLGKREGKDLVYMGKVGTGWSRTVSSQIIEGAVFSAHRTRGAGDAAVQPTGQARPHARSGI